MRRPGRPAYRLRQTIDHMPLETRRAMLQAIAVDPIIVGAYTDGAGGICPMLAAHRNGGRTDFAAFAGAWDRYTRAGTQSRLATERERRTLQTMLEASVADAWEASLAEAIDAHRASKAISGDRGGAPRRSDTGERNRTGELARRHGWAWLRPFRRLDEFERAVGDLDAAGTSAQVPAGRLCAAGSGRPQREPVG